jgi:pimeloyl-ACP methyl ester carboxylesterase
VARAWLLEMTRAATVEAVGGLRRTVGGQPRLGDLPLSTQALIRGSIGFDLVLRTAVASLVAVPASLSATRPETRRQLDHLAFYRELAAARDPGAAFAAPPPGVAVDVLAAPRGSFKAPGGQVRMLRFESPYQVMNPEAGADYSRHRENRLAWAQHWSHDDGPRPTLAVIHGFGASPYWLNSMFFSLPWLYGQGYDVLMYLLPFHGVRQARAAFSGWGLFAHGIAHFVEAMGHAVHDFRVFMDHLFADGVPQIALTGLSLGGCVSALLAAVEERLALVVPNAPVVNVAKLARQWFPANLALAGGLRLGGLDWGELEETLAVVSPLNYPPLVPHGRRMIIGGLGDRLAPPEQADWLWEHWERPRLHWFPGNHVLHAGRGVYLKEMLAFMREVDFR